MVSSMIVAGLIKTSFLGLFIHYFCKCLIKRKYTAIESLSNSIDFESFEQCRDITKCNLAKFKVNGFQSIFILFALFAKYLSIVLAVIATVAFALYCF